MRVREREPRDREAAAAFLAENHSHRVARLGRLEHPIEHPALVAEDDDGRMAGMLTYVVDGDALEILTLHAVARRRGAGTALVEEARRMAAARGCRRVWVLTTNDNVHALRFYQRRGFRLAELHPGAVDESRARLKPEIPAVGEHGIAIRDEIVLEREP